MFVFYNRWGYSKIRERLRYTYIWFIKELWKKYESYIIVGEEPRYINGEKAYMATVYRYEKGDDFWIHQNIYVFENRIE